MPKQPSKSVCSDFVLRRQWAPSFGPPQPPGPLRPRCSPPHCPSPPLTHPPPRLSILTTLDFQDENGHAMQREKTQQIGLCGHLASNKMLWDSGDPWFFLKHVMASGVPPSTSPEHRLTLASIWVTLGAGWVTQGRKGGGGLRGVFQAKAAGEQGAPGRPGPVEAETSSPQLCPLLCSASR